MSILLDGGTGVLIYGMETALARAQYAEMLKAGTQVVGAVTPSDIDYGAPIRIFADASHARQEAVGDIGLAVIFSQPTNALSAAMDAIDSGIRTVLCVTEHVPVHDALRMRHRAAAAGSMLIGPNSTGILTPRRARAGYFCDDICLRGSVGVVGKSGSVGYAALSEMKAAGLGASTVVSVGGDLVKGTDFCGLLALFEADPETDRILLLGEVGGSDEEGAASFLAGRVSKPVVAFVSGRSLAPGQKVGHAGAIIAHGQGGYESKVHALRAAGVVVADEFSDIVPLLQAVKLEGSRGETRKYRNQQGETTV